VNVAGCFAAQCDFGAFDTVDGRIAGGSAAQHVNRGLRQEAKVHEVIKHIMGQLERVHHCRRTHFHLTQRHYFHLDHVLDMPSSAKPTEAVAYLTITGCPGNAK
jgi:hypothetical protein